MVEHSFTSKGFRVKIGLNTDPGELLDPDPEPGEQKKRMPVDPEHFMTDGDIYAISKIQ